MEYPTSTHARIRSPYRIVSTISLHTTAVSASLASFRERERGRRGNAPETHPGDDGEHRVCRCDTDGVDEREHARGRECNDECAERAVSAAKAGEVSGHVPHQGRMET